MNTPVKPAAGQAGPGADDVDLEAGVPLATLALTDSEAMNKLAFSAIVPAWLKRELQGQDGMTDAERAQFEEEEHEKAIRRETEAFNTSFRSYDESFNRYEQHYGEFKEHMAAWQRVEDEEQAKIDEEKKELERRKRGLDDQVLDDGTKLHRDDQGKWHNENGETASATQAEEAERKRQEASESIDRDAERVAEKQRQLNEFKTKREALERQADEDEKRRKGIDAADRDLAEKIRKGEITDPEEIKRAREKIDADRKALDQEDAQRTAAERDLYNNAPDFIRNNSAAPQPPSAPDQGQKSSQAAPVSDSEQKVAVVPKLMTDDYSEDDYAAVAAASQPATFANTDGQGIQASVRAKATFNTVAPQTSIVASSNTPVNTPSTNRDRTVSSAPV